MRFAAALWGVLWLAGVPAASFAQSLDETIADAVLHDATFPDVSDDIDADAAYTIQASVVGRAFGAKIAGYKAGLTSAAAQQRFGVDQPVLGVLPESARLAPNVTIAMTPGLKIEVEVGFVVGSGDAPAAMLAAIELPRLAYADMKQVSLVDIVATNVSAYRFIAGPRIPVAPDVRTYPVSLDHDGVRVFDAAAADALGDPLEAYAWMVEKVHALGYRLDPGMVLITGSLGHVVDAEPGRYVAHYGPLGELEFKIGQPIVGSTRQ